MHLHMQQLEVKRNELFATVNLKAVVHACCSKHKGQEN